MERTERRRGSSGGNSPRRGPVESTAGRVKTGEEFHLLETQMAKRASGGECINRTV